MIRITTHADGDHTVVAIAGQIAEPDVREIRRVWKSVGGDVVLNLRDLDASTPEGVVCLREWIHAGAHLQKASPFIAMILKGSADRQPS